MLKDPLLWYSYIFFSRESVFLNSNFVCNGSLQSTGTVVIFLLSKIGTVRTSTSYRCPKPKKTEYRTFLKYFVRVRYLLEDGSAEVCSISDAGVDDEIRRGIAQTKVVLQQENDVPINQLKIVCKTGYGTYVPK